MVKIKDIDKSGAFDEMSKDEMVKLAAVATKCKKTNGDDCEFLPEGTSQMVLFKGKEIRETFHDNEWYFSIVDVIEAVTDTDRPSKYWSDLKKQLTENEDFYELSEKIGQLKMAGPDGKMYKTDVVNVETLFRIVQSIPSKKAEPFKKWLAKVGYERIQETQNPEISIKRAMLNWQIQGRDDDWIEARLRTIVVRHELTSEWQKRGITEGPEYGQLTNIISKATFGVKTDEHKKIKKLTSQSLRDHMTDLELVLTMLGEKSTAAIAQAVDAQGFLENAETARSGGKVAGDARKGLEAKLGKSIVSSSNFLANSNEDKNQELPLKKKK